MTERRVHRLGVRDVEAVAAARQRARELAGLVGCPQRTQLGFAIAVSELARNAVVHGGGGEVEFLIDAQARLLLARIVDRGPGMADPEGVLADPSSEGLTAARRMVPRFELVSAPGQGTTAVAAVGIPRAAGRLDAEQLSGRLQDDVQVGVNESLSAQNRELAESLRQLKEREEELERTVRELEATNRGVLALHAELDERAQMLVRASDLKSRFMSILSHEFRTPLSAVLSLSQLLLDRVDGELTREQERQVAFIKSSAESLLDIANDLLDLAKVEAGRMAVRPGRFEVESLFGALRGTLRPLARGKDVELVFEPPQDVPPLLTDEGKVNQILRNFITNALKFTERGEVRVSARRVGDQEVEFSVRDTGIGLAEEDIPRIFEAWTQVDSQAGRRHKGSGLGLPLTRQLVELLGGELSVESELGKGSTFRAVLPIAYRGPLDVRFEQPEAR